MKKMNTTKYMATAKEEKFHLLIREEDLLNHPKMHHPSVVVLVHIYVNTVMHLKEVVKRKKE